MTLSEVYRKAFEVNGEGVQLIVCFEEFSELQKELSKYYRGFDNKSEIAEETADVIMVLFEQLDHIGITFEDIVLHFEHKANRLAENLGASLDGRLAE